LTCPSKCIHSAVSMPWYTCTATPLYIPGAACKWRNPARSCAGRALRVLVTVMLSSALLISLRASLRLLVPRRCVASTSLDCSRPAASAAHPYSTDDISSASPRLRPATAATSGAAALSRDFLASLTSMLLLTVKPLRHTIPVLRHQVQPSLCLSGPRKRSRRTVCRPLLRTPVPVL
jgi:hypothetical protein